ncbi:unnamed protein product, partial [Soboliphyme baturini]|uniref:Transmembrane protein n=1 Tax=Soboliphyme baturini TaxID=241478 RepID=A0A183J568_9BILA
SVKATALPTCNRSGQTTGEHRVVVVVVVVSAYFLGICVFRLVSWSLVGHFVNRGSRVATASSVAASAAAGYPTGKDEIDCPPNRTNTKERPSDVGPFL